jgi:hypothetical protein
VRKEEEINKQTESKQVGGWGIEDGGIRKEVGAMVHLRGEAERKDVGKDRKPGEQEQLPLKRAEPEKLSGKIRK